MMLPNLESHGITRYVLESREEAQDKTDVALALSMRAKGLCKRIDLAHLKATEDSRLWIPAQLLGAYRDMRCGVSDRATFHDAWNQISPHVNTMEIML